MHPSPGELEARCVAAGLVVKRPATPRDLDQTREYLTRWVEVVDTAEPAKRAALLNALLASSAAHPRLTNHTGRGMHRLGRCAADGCDRVFADVSRTGRQRYCTSGCANRDAVRRHRARAEAGDRVSPRGERHAVGVNSSATLSGSRPW